ncbi:MAG: hypothetical protein HZB18_02175 [Chloroflexi bacterium]|nr:hypothetical protein [Chloroflexota bacterium]
MKTFQERKTLIKILAVALLVLMCFNWPSLLYWPLCLKEDIFRPPNTEILVSACKSPIVRGVPGGEALFVYEGLTDKMYLLDLRTREKRHIPSDPLLLEKGIFLSPELVWLEGSLVGPDNLNYRPHYILDLTNGQRYKLVDLKWKPPNNLFENGELNPIFLRYFTDAEQVFIYHTENRLIALAPNFRQHPEKNVILPQASLGSVSLSSENSKLLEKLMKDLEVDYEIVDFSLYYADVPSPTRKYIVRGDGIYLLGTSTLVVNRDMGFYFRSWYYDESGVVFAEPGYFLISGSLTGSHFPFPRPVLKLRLPAP